MKRILILSFVLLTVATTLVSVAREPSTTPREAPVDTGARLLLLDLQGPSFVAANGAEDYTVLAKYTDGTVVNVTDRSDWSVDSPYAHIAGGVLSVDGAPDEHSMIVTAWFTDGISLKATRTVTLKEATDENARPRVPEDTKATTE